MDSLSDEVLDDLRRLVTKSLEVRTIQDGTAPFIVIPNDSKIESLASFIYNEHQQRPGRIKGTVNVMDGESFCEYYKLFSDEHSRVFADEVGRSMVAVLDHHEAHGQPRWGQHRLILALRYSPEWGIWTGSNGKKFSQVDFAEFIEQNSTDIVRPSAATMLEMARDLTAKTEVDFSSGIAEVNGSVRLKYTEQIKATYGSGEVAIPETFTVAIPVHVGGEPVGLEARLRYRINSGKLTFWYDLLRVRAMERAAFCAHRDQITTTLNVTAINGTPA